MVPSARAFLDAAFARGESAGGQAKQLSRLLEEFPAAEVEAAVREAIERQTPRASSVSFIPSIAAVAPVPSKSGPLTSHAIRIFRIWRYPHTNWRFTMNSLMMTNNDLTGQLRQLGLQATAQELDDLIARATKQKWSPLQLIEAIARSESANRAARNLQRRLKLARLGRFKPIADFDWDWPKKIDRELVERALRTGLYRGTAQPDSDGRQRPGENLHREKHRLRGGDGRQKCDPGPPRN